MSEVLKGGCLCGAVRYSANAEPMMVGHCYCVDCRKTSATSHATHLVMPEDAVSFTGDLSCYDRPADSGNIVRRSFCPKCGSAVLSHNDGMPGLAFLRASSLDNPDAISPTANVYTSRAPAWAILDESIPSFAEMPEGGPEAMIAAQ
ncbi:GFA family protein [Altererythrobacter sp.]|uniref:GFA family protein n=1 Tax=Altererythrobacter sp. TaxID=1872480 RepID=UPI003D084E69